MIKQNQRVLNVVMVLADALVVTIALFCAWWLRFKTTLFGPIGGHLGLQSYVLFLTFAVIPTYFTNLIELIKQFFQKQLSL